MRNGLASLLMLVILSAVALPTVEAGGLEGLFAANGSWSEGPSPAALSSLTWAGETETWAWTPSLPLVVRVAVEIDPWASNPDLVAGLPAPEPPAILLAGMALGSVLFGRSFLSRRPKVEADDVARDSEG